MLGDESPPEFNKEPDTSIDTGKEDNSLSTNGEETWNSYFQKPWNCVMSTKGFMHYFFTMVYEELDKAISSLFTYSKE